MQIKPLTDLAAMRRLGLACGLEDEGRGDDGVLAAWGAFAGERLVGAVCLERRDGRDTANWLAVDRDYRRRGIATALFTELEGEAAARGITRLWVTARTPAFFFARGYQPVQPGAEHDALLHGCLDCDQYGVGCEPQALTRVVVRSADRDRD